MRRIWVVLTALCLMLTSVAFFTACEVVSGSGKTVSQGYSFTDFTRVSANWTFNVEVSFGAAYSINVTVDDNLQKYLEVSRDGDTLKLGMQEGRVYRNEHLKAVITTPRLTALTLSGASKGSASGFNSADDFTLNVSGASQATFSNMVVNKLTLDISGASRATGSAVASGNAVLQASGASNITLSGKAVDADVESSGASGVNLTDFAVRDAHVDISGASNATVSATGAITGDVSGASHLNYTDNPATVNVDTSGASSVNKK